MYNKLARWAKIQEVLPVQKEETSTNNTSVHQVSKKLWGGRGDPKKSHAMPCQNGEETSYPVNLKWPEDQLKYFIFLN